MRTVSGSVKKLGRDSCSQEARVSVLLSLLWCVVVAGTVTGTSFAQSTALSAPWTQKVLPVGFSTNRSQSEIGHGYLWTFQRVLSSPSSEDAIVLTSLANGESTKLGFWLHKASRIWVDDVAAGSSHSVIVTGAYIQPDSSSEKRFIAQLDASGAVVSSADLGSYEAEHVCAADNTIWTFGQEWSSEANGGSYAMLRNYSLEGQLLKSYLPRHDVPLEAFNLGRRFHQTGTGRGRSYLRCGESSVGIYIAPAGLWYEVRLSDGAAHSWSVITPSDESHEASHTATGRRRVSGFALLGEHEVYATIAEVTGIGASASRGLFRLQLASEGSAHWEPVLGTLSSDPIHSVARLLGGDGESLVYLLAGSASSDGLPLCCSKQYFATHPPLLWSKPISRSND